MLKSSETHHKHTCLNSVQPNADVARKCANSAQKATSCCLLQYLKTFGHLKILGEKQLISYNAGAYDILLPWIAEPPGVILSWPLLASEPGGGACCTLSTRRLQRSLPPTTPVWAPLGTAVSDGPIFPRTLLPASHHSTLFFSGWTTLKTLEILNIVSTATF